MPFLEESDSSPVVEVRAETSVQVKNSRILVKACHTWVSGDPPQTIQHINTQQGIHLQDLQSPAYVMTDASLMAARNLFVHLVDLVGDPQRRLELIKVLIQLVLVPNDPQSVCSRCSPLLKTNCMYNLRELAKNAHY